LGEGVFGLPPLTVERIQMPHVKHQGGAVAEVDDSLVETLVATGEWELAGVEKPAPVKRVRKAAPKVEEAPVSE
jgi:hypothetical protein